MDCADQRHRVGTGRDRLTALLSRISWAILGFLALLAELSVVSGIMPAVVSPKISSSDGFLASSFSRAASSARADFAFLCCFSKSPASSIEGGRERFSACFSGGLIYGFSTGGTDGARAIWGC